MGWADYLANRSARRWLDTLAGRFEAGWSALAADSTLWPSYERHLAAVTDTVRCEEELITRPEPVSDLVLIASHAHDVWTEAVANGWAPPKDVAGWTPQEWAGLRMLACFRLAAAQPHGPKLGSTAERLRRPPASARKRVR